MKQKEFKLGFSNIGGIFIGKDIQSDFLKNYAITVLISFGESFRIKSENKKDLVCRAALIQKNTGFNVKTGSNDFIAFIHILPYSNTGLQLSDQSNRIKELNSPSIDQILNKIKDWFHSTYNDSEVVEKILISIAENVETKQNQSIIDERILKSFKIIAESEDEKLSVYDVAPKVYLSVSHFNRLFKKETGLTFRKFVLHNKLIKSLFALSQHSNLTQAAFIGGFADQAHLSRTFKNNFGIKPSTSKK